MQAIQLLEQRVAEVHALCELTQEELDAAEEMLLAAQMECTAGAAAVQHNAQGNAAPPAQEHALLDGHGRNEMAEDELAANQVHDHVPAGGDHAPQAAELAAGHAQRAAPAADGGVDPIFQQAAEAAGGAAGAAAEGNNAPVGVPVDAAHAVGGGDAGGAVANAAGAAAAGDGGAPVDAERAAGNGAMPAGMAAGVGGGGGGGGAPVDAAQLADEAGGAVAGGAAAAGAERPAGEPGGAMQVAEGVQAAAEPEQGPAAQPVQEGQNGAGADAGVAWDLAAGAAAEIDALAGAAAPPPGGDAGADGEQAADDNGAQQNGAPAPAVAAQALAGDPGAGVAQQDGAHAADAQAAAGVLGLMAQQVLAAQHPGQPQGHANAVPGHVPPIVPGVNFISVAQQVRAAMAITSSSVHARQTVCRLTCLWR